MIFVKKKIPFKEKSYLKNHALGNSWLPRNNCLNVDLSAFLKTTVKEGKIKKRKNKKGKKRVILWEFS